MRSMKPFISAKLLAFINKQKDGLEASVVRLAGAPLSVKDRNRLKRKIRTYRKTLKAVALEIDNAKREAEKEPIRAVYSESLDPNRKAKARAPNRGFKRDKPPTPNGKERGAYVVIRPKRLTK